LGLAANLSELSVYATTILGENIMNFKGKRFLFGFNCQRCRDYERFPKPILVSNTFRDEFICYDCAMERKEPQEEMSQVQLKYACN